MPLGLYIHIPYCAALCHYCDFAKTANFSREQQAAYLRALEAQFAEWVERLRLGPGAFTSLYFGGGTPGLFSQEYEPLFTRLRPYLAEGCEVTLEANPGNLSAEKLAAWAGLGVNRLSVGVQTFSEAGLSFLKRDHSAEEAREGLRRAVQLFPNTSLDLIYGWPGQTEALWEADLQEALALNPAHVSLYNLTYAEGTPIGRAQQRGRLEAVQEELELAFYEKACARLAAAGFEHYEVSNWGRPGRESRHNQLYWRNDSYVALGAGAHGFIPAAEGPLGLRYSYPRSDRSIIAGAAPLFEASRSREDWLLEALGSGLRTREGLDLVRLEASTGYRFEADARALEALSDGLLSLSATKLLLAEREWFRETAWCTLLYPSFKSL